MKFYSKFLNKTILNEGFILSLIVINSITIFLQGFDFNKSFETLILTIDNSISIIFIAELVFKLFINGTRKYFSSGWNIFDSILILSALPSIFLWVFNLETVLINSFLVLRIARLFKFFRFIKFFPNINQLLSGILRALKASVIILFAFLIYNFIISVVSYMLFKDIAPLYFSDPLKSFYSIFKIFTMEGWYDIPDYIAENSSILASILTKIYFIIIVLSGGVFGLSLVNSIFVDAMVSDNNDELEKKVESLEKKIDILLNKK